MRMMALLVMLVLAGPVSAQIKLPASVSGDKGDWLTIKADTAGTELLWFPKDKRLKVFPPELLKDQRVAVVYSNFPGTYELIAVTTVEGRLYSATMRVEILGDPVPPGPLPPIPPGPDPPGPNPPPIPTAGLRVLIIYESADKLPAKQRLILTAKEVRDYLDAKCIVGADGKTKEYRVLDKDVSLKNEAPHWQDAMKLPRTGLPWIVISNGKTGASGPLPGTVAETITLLKKYGG